MMKWFKKQDPSAVNAQLSPDKAALNIMALADPNAFRKAANIFKTYANSTQEGRTPPVNIEIDESDLDCQAIRITGNISFALDVLADNKLISSRDRNKIQKKLPSENFNIESQNSNSQF